MSNFKVGDRVAVYHGMGNRIVGTVTEPPSGWHEPNAIRVLADEDDRGEARWAHPKQCRKLVKRELRRLWIISGDVEGITKHHGVGKVWASTSEPMHADPVIEFVEVRRKK